MTLKTTRALVLAGTMVASSALAYALKTNDKATANHSVIGLEQIVPENFAGWSVDKNVIPVLPSPELEAKLNRIYDETLARTYVNSRGERIMLSIAYGGDQTGRLRVHRPESCYSGQGFIVQKIGEDNLPTATGQVSIKRLFAQSGPRHEPITYWIRVGDTTVSNLLGQRITQLRFALTGEVPDGLIFRVSSLGENTKDAYSLHDRFINDLLRSVSPEQKATLIGKVISPAGTEPSFQ